jgi:16S rRNA G966 N2-methylase RsmD
MFFFKKIAKAILTPISFSFKTGHFWSAMAGKSMDSNRNPIPMLTYPALEVLASMDLAKVSILEFGSGQSSIYFDQRVKKLTSIESSPQWARYVRNNTSSKVNLYVCPEKKDFKLVQKKIVNKQFDIVLIDGVPYKGGDRMEAANLTLNLANNPKLVIVDNSDLRQCLPIINAFEINNYIRADFIGYSPKAYHKQSTSFFFLPEFAEWALANESVPSDLSPYSNKNEI